jgi:holo-[acyl-carrier protein] synthase
LRTTRRSPDGELRKAHYSIGRRSAGGTEGRRRRGPAAASLEVKSILFWNLQVLSSAGPWEGALVLGLGMDLVEVERIERALARGGDRLLARLMAERERAAIDRGDDPGARARAVAVHFAAKEAALKALGTGWAAGVSWRDVALVPVAGGGHAVELTGGALRIAAALGVLASHAAVACDGRIASAIVILEGGA